jgi:hypothetical protein
VSALMSAAMVNLGIYGIVRVGFDLLGGGPRWWWLLVLGAGAVSAVYGILQAAMASDLKRLLAYSTSENMGLVLIGLGAAGLFAAAGNGPLAGLALAAALLHVVNHSAFKALLFCAAGSVLRATGLRDLDALGGLRGRMPVTAGLFAVAALGAVALPPGNGFISEWLLLQALIHGLVVPGVSTAIVLPVAVAAIRLARHHGVLGARARRLAGRGESRARGDPGGARRLLDRRPAQSLPRSMATCHLRCGPVRGTPHRAAAPTGRRRPLHHNAGRETQRTDPGQSRPLRRNSAAVLLHAATPLTTLGPGPVVAPVRPEGGS